MPPLLPALLPGNPLLGPIYLSFPQPHSDGDDPDVIYNSRREAISKVKGYMICLELDPETPCEETELVTIELSNPSALLDPPFLGLSRVIGLWQSSFNRKCAFLSVQGEVPDFSLIKVSGSFQLHYISTLNRNS